MKVLELLSGTGSVGTVCKEHDCEVAPLDRDMPADIRADIMDWDYKAFPPRHFDFIWASPPCTEYSVATTIGHKDIEGSTGSSPGPSRSSDTLTPSTGRWRTLRLVGSRSKI